MRLSLFCFAIAGAACSAVAFEPLEPEPPLPPVLPPVQPPVEPELVTDPPMVDVSVRCEELAAGEEVLTISSEGDLWITEESSASQGLRVLQPGGSSQTLPLTIAGDFRAARAWGGSDATLVVDDDLWTVSEEGQEYLFVPESLRGVRHFCGDPERDGWVAVVTDSGLYDREVGEWFSIGPEAGMSFASIEWLTDVDGACRTPGGGLWFGVGESVWRIDESEIRGFDVPGATGPAQISETFGVVVPTRDKLLFAPEPGPTDDAWSEVEFAAGAIDAIGAGGGVLWVAAGSRLFRYDGAWREAEGVPENAPSQIHADARGGAWLMQGREICYVGVHDVSVRGVRPYEILRGADVELSIEAAGATTVEVRVDDGALTAAVRAGDHYRVAAFGVDAPGWHRLEVVVDGELRRSIPYRVVGVGLSWASDIRPVFDVHCGSSMCHGADTEDAVRLDSFDAWVANARAIRGRITDGTMPRGAGTEWTIEVATKVIDWTEGLRP